MEREELNAHLSQISTVWTDLFQAHAGPGEAVTAAQRRLVVRYTPAVYAYLLGAVHDPETADDLFQEFALRFVRGDFKGADPARGRFRDFLKTSLCHLVIDYQRRRRRWPAALPSEVPDPAGPEPPLAAANQQFLTVWLAELMDRTWQALEHHERASGQPLYTVLRGRADHPDLPAPALAEWLAARLNRPVTTEWVYKRLHLARQKFTDLLVEEVAQSLDHPTAEQLEEELSDLGLLERCRSALRRRAPGRPAAVVPALGPAR